jgi:hypothetical protein
MRVGLLWRREWDPPSAEPPKLRGVFAAFSALRVEAEAVVYSDDEVEAVREQLLELDGVLVWVNPIEQGLDRSLLNPLLQEAADAGVFVSAHPGVIERMGTKQVLVDTREMSWGTATRVYRDWDELCAKLPDRLWEGAPLVLKQMRGMGGQGVWRVENWGRGWRRGPVRGSEVLAQHAAAGAEQEVMSLEDFLEIWRSCGAVVEQPYLDRVREGMKRVYLTHDRVVGFTQQFPRGLVPPGVELPPSTKVFEPSDAPAFRDLRERAETEWVPEMQRILGLTREQLPVIWDLDFLHGEGNGFVLCEINVSSTFAFPDIAMPGVAQATIERVRER